MRRQGVGNYSDIPHLSQNHGREFLGGERPVLAINFNGNRGLPIVVGNSEREVFEIGLNVFVGPLAANESPVEALAWRG